MCVCVCMSPIIAYSRANKEAAMCWTQSQNGKEKLVTKLLLGGSTRNVIIMF